MSVRIEVRDDDDDDDDDGWHFPKVKKKKNEKNKIERPLWTTPRNRTRIITISVARVRK